MKNALLIIVLLVSGITFGQKVKKKDLQLNLSNAVVIGQLDNPADRYSIEANLTELFANSGVKSIASLSLMKLGADSQGLAADSTLAMAKGKGFDTYVLVSIRGYDKRYKVSSSTEDFTTSLGRASLFGLYQQDVVSVTFEFKFFRDGKMVHAETIKCGNAGSRSKVLTKIRKKVSKKLDKSWK